MSAREEILARVRRSLAPHPSAAGLPPVEVPRRYTTLGASRPTAGEVADLFAERVEDYRATLTRVSLDRLPQAIAEALADLPPNLATDGSAGAGRVVVPDGVDEGWLSALDPTRVVRDNGLSAAELDTIAAVVTAAAVGVALTGTIVLDHGPDQGRRALTLVPDLHVCVIRESQLVPDIPNAIAHLAPTAAAGHPQTWISGPSATSDIELQRIEGVHGPRTLRVILVE